MQMNTSEDIAASPVLVELEYSIIKRKCMHTDFKAQNEMLKGKDVVALKPETT